MSRLLWWIGSTVGGALGWWLGHRFGMFVAGFLSLVGTAVGVYWARRTAANYL